MSPLSDPDTIIVHGLSPRCRTNGFIYDIEVVVSVWLEVDIVEGNE